MELIRCQAFEYSLHVAEEYYQYRNFTFEAPKIIWSLNGKFITAETLLFNEHGSLLSYPVEWGEDVDQHLISLSDTENNLFSLVRTTWFKKYDHTFPLAGITKSNCVLFDQMKQLISNLDFSSCKPNGNKIFNVHFLENDQKFPFLEIKSSDLLEPASLVSKS